MKKRDLERVENDRKIDALIETESGRDEFWKTLQLASAGSSLIALLESTLHLDGDIIECGVFRGASLWNTARSVKENAPDKTIFALDSFEGFPKEQVTEKDTQWFRPALKLRQKFRHANDVPERIEKIFSYYGIKGGPRIGFFETTLPAFKNNRFCFAHIDSDTYSSHIECLAALYDNIVSGGVIAFDDYHEKNWPGATVAVDEFLKDRPEKPQLDKSRAVPCWYMRKI